MGEETALSSYILNSKRFFFPHYIELLCASPFIIDIRHLEDDIFCVKSFLKGFITNSISKLWNNFFERTAFIEL